MGHIGKPLIQKNASINYPMLNGNNSYLIQHKQDNIIKTEKGETDKIMKQIEDDVFSDGFDDDDFDPKFITTQKLINPKSINLKAAPIK